MPVAHKSTSSPYRPWIEVSVTSGEDPAGLGSILAVLHYSARDSVILREYELEGLACPHEFEPTEDLKELDKLMAQAKAIGQTLKIPVRIDKDALADLVWGSAGTEG